MTKPDLLEIDLWSWSLDDTNAAGGLWDLLSDGERQAAAAFHHDRDRQDFIVRRGRLREILADYAGLAPHRLSFLHQSGGKPYLTDGPEFSLSHTARRAAVAVSKGVALGLDIERPRPVRPDISQAFAASERTYITALPEPARQAALFRVWTHREALAKGMGLGVWNAAERFELDLSGAEVRITAIRGAAHEYRAWSLIALDDTFGLPAALAIRAESRPFTVRRNGTPPAV